MFREVDTRVPHEVEAQVQSVYRKLFPEAPRGFVAQAFEWAELCFSGQYDDYLAIDARYHDFEHTLQGTLCFARLLQGRHLAKAQPPVNQKLFELGLLAILFHDTGYLKKQDDPGGTGAKYTLIHVGRSALFARDFLSARGYSTAETNAIENMIRCTGVNVDLASIPFHSELERTLGFALGTADLLGQMAAHDYVDKLPVLYLEFAEAARFSGDPNSRAAGFANAEDLMRKTPGFFHHYVLPRINEDFRELYRFLNDPYPDGPNHYLDRIQKNLARLKEQINQLK